MYGLDPELLMMVPRPVAAVMLLYPITEKVPIPMFYHSHFVTSILIGRHYTVTPF